MSLRRNRPYLSVLLVAICLLMLALGIPAFAQGGAPIQIGQNATGSISTEATTAQFSLTVTGNQTAAIQVLALSAGFVPRFSVLNPAGIEILTISNAEGKSTLTGNATFSDAGVYTIVVAGENGSTGQFVLSLQAGAPMPEPVTLTVDQPISARVGTQRPSQIYRFNTTSLGAVTLTVLSQTPGFGPLVTLYDESASKTIASNDAGVIGVAYQLPAGEKQYRVTVSAAGTDDTIFSICVGTCGGGLQTGSGSVQPTPTPDVIVPPAATPETSSVGACTAASSAGGSVNLRSGPGTNYLIQQTLPLGQAVQVLGVWTGGGWYEVNVNGSVLWVGGSVVFLSGDCSALPAVPAPPNAPLAPTHAPTQASNNNGNNGNNGNNNNPPPSDTPEQPLPNLTVINIRITNPGDGTLNIDITVVNAGSAPVDAPYAVKTCLDGATCDEITGFASGLQPGETMSFTDGLAFDGSAGTHVVSVEVDSQNEVTESNESDNAAFSSFNN